MINNDVFMSSFTIRNSTPTEVRIEVFLDGQLMNWFNIEENEVSSIISMGPMNCGKLCFCVTNLNNGSRSRADCPEALIYSPKSGVSELPLSLGVNEGEYVMLAAAFMPVDSFRFENEIENLVVFSIFSARMNKIVFTSQPIPDDLKVDLNTLLTTDSDTLTISATPRGSMVVTSIAPAMFIRGANFNGVYLLANGSKGLFLERLI